MNANEAAFGKRTKSPRTKTCRVGGRSPRRDLTESRLGHLSRARRARSYRRIYAAAFPDMHRELYNLTSSEIQSS